MLSAEVKLSQQTESWVFQHKANTKHYLRACIQLRITHVLPGSSWPEPESGTRANNSTSKSVRMKQEHSCDIHFHRRIVSSHTSHSDHHHDTSYDVYLMTHSTHF